MRRDSSGGTSIAAQCRQNGESSPLGGLVVQDQEIPHALVLEPGLAIVGIDQHRIAMAIGKHAQETREA